MKSIEFLQKKATALYFYDVTSHFRLFEQRMQLVQQEQSISRQSLSQISISKHAKELLTSILVLLESLFRNELDEKQSEVIIVVISQVNFMLCFFNDMLDLKMIEQGNFVTVNEGYRPHEVFNYVLSIFKQ